MQNFYWKIKFLKQATYITCVIAKLSKFCLNQHADPLRILFMEDYWITWRHDIWISEKLKFDYLKNEKSFQSEIKNIFLRFTSDFTTFKSLSMLHANTPSPDMFWRKQRLKWQNYLELYHKFLTPPKEGQTKV